MDIEIINIGDELLIGQVINTNCSYMAQKLNEVGFNVKYITVINDNPNQIKDSIVLALQRVDAVLITGGLGPTKDDMTKFCLNEMFGGHLIENIEVSTHVRNFFEKRNLPYTSTNRSQAMVPDCCQVIFNPIGTAPGMVFNSKDCILYINDLQENGNGKLVISMPGVPFEMEKMMEQVIPILSSHYNSQTIIHKNILVCGIGESFLSDKLEEFENGLKEFNNKHSDKNISLAYLPASGIIKLRLSLHGDKDKSSDKDFDIVYKQLKNEVKDYIVSEDDKNLAQIIGEKLQLLSKTLSTAESCTGGNIAHRITLNSGASSYFKGGVVSYCNEIKNKVLGVKKSLLDKYGAVSKQTAIAMAEGVLSLYDTDFAISTTGLAGPDSDGSDNEIGTVYIAIAIKNKATIVKKSCFKTSRSNFIDRVTNFALFELLNVIRNS